MRYVSLRRRLIGVGAARQLVAWIAAVVTFTTASAGAQTPPRLAWDSSPEPDVAGYVVEYGSAPARYTETVDVGRATTWALPAALTSGSTYYFAVRAYNSSGVRSPLSQPVSYTVPEAFTPVLPQTQLYWQHSATGSVAVWQMSGTTQRRGQLLGPGHVADPGWRIAATGDFNHDGYTDVVWQHRDGWISAWLLRGAALLDGRLLKPNRVADAAWRIAAAADMNADGVSDLIWQHQTSGMLSVWYMADTSMREGVLLEPSSVADRSWKIVGAGDLNRDGNPDLLWRHDVSGHIAVWYMAGGRMLSAELLTPSAVTDANWRIRGVTDMTGDGAPDIIWQHTDGRLAVWVMNGSKLVSGEPLTPSAVSDTGWQLVGSR